MSRSQVLQNYEEYLLVKGLNRGLDTIPTNIKLIVQKLDDKVLESTGQDARQLPFDTILNDLMGVETYDQWLDLGGMKVNEYDFDDAAKAEIETAIEMKFEEVEAEFGEVEVAPVVEVVKTEALNTLDILMDDGYGAELQQSLEAAMTTEVIPGRISVTPTVISPEVLASIATTKKTKEVKPKSEKAQKIVTPRVAKQVVNYPLQQAIIQSLLQKIEHTMNFKGCTGVEQGWKEGRQEQFEREFHKLKRSTDSSQYFVRNGITFEVDEVDATIFVMNDGPEFVVLTFDEDFLVILDRNAKLGREKMNLVFAGSPTTESDKLSKVLTRYKAAMTKYNGDVPGAVRW
jgi:hypothetical protein